jgi:L,D-transpeptidase catalytic domain
MEGQPEHCVIGHIGQHGCARFSDSKTGLEYHMRRRRLALTFIAAIVALTFTAPARANVMIIIDKSTQKMSVTVNGEERYLWPVSTGRAGYDTPSGDFQPFRMEKDHYSREWDDAPMPNSIFFSKIGHAIHGTFEARNLGRAASHGCVRLSTQNAATLYALVKEEGVFHTRVRLIGDTPQSEQPVARDRDAERNRNYVRNYSDDDDPPQRSRSTRGWITPDNARSNYYYRSQPSYDRRGYGRGFFPFGW